MILPRTADRPVNLAAINELKQEMNAVIMGHYYQKNEVQDVADFIGDSLELARKAAKPMPMSSFFAACISWLKAQNPCP